MVDDNNFALLFYGHNNKQADDILGVKMKALFYLILLAGFTCNIYANNLSYCQKNGGQVESMSVNYDTHAGMVKGWKKQFCTFDVDNGGFIAIGLETFASTKPNLAATFIKIMPKFPQNSALLKGPYNNPSLNLCLHLGGASVSFNILDGGFRNHLGQNDICVFGDGSMVSGWSLIYMANGRKGYDAVKRAVKSKPLDINLPGVNSKKPKAVLLGG